MVSLDATSASDSQAFYSSLVIEHIVAKDRSTAFQKWREGLISTASCHVGFVRVDRCPPLPCEDDVTKWYSIVHFDSPESLNHWIASKARKQMLQSGQRIFRAYRFKSFTTGLEGWFSQQATRGTHGAEKSGLGPPAWKQILSVVFGLYPILMVRLKLFPGTSIIGDWSPAGEMLISTLITSTLLGVVVMPVVTRMMGFWLYPAYRQVPGKIDITGLILIGLGLILMAAAFDRV